MENKRNNATEKVENLTTKKEAFSKTEKPKKSGNKSINATKTVKKTVKDDGGTVEKVKKSEKSGDEGKTEISKEREKYELKREREEVLKKEREEKARIKRAKKEEREKAKKAKALAVKKAKKAKADLKKKKQEEYRLEKLRKKEERLARRDFLKHESKEERKNRLAAEKQAKFDAKEKVKQETVARREERAALKRQKLADRKALKEQKRNLRAENRREKRGRGIGGWLAAVISLASVVLVLGTLFALNLLGTFGVTEKNDRSVAETYYDLVDYVGNMDVNMSKLLVSGDESRQQKLLTEISTEASLAASDISRLPIKDEGKYYTTKFINQVADYAKYLNNRLIDGHSLTEKDYENLKNLYEINNKLKNEFAALSDNIGEDFDFSTILDDNGDNLFIEKFMELESNAVEYPKLIYDGPFADALEEKTPKGLMGEEITSRQAEEIFNKIFASRKVDNLEIVSESKGKIEAYNIEADTEQGVLHGTISKKGGKLLMFNHYMDCMESKVDLKDAVEIADKFLKDLKMPNMKAVWATENETTCYINYCYDIDNVTVYPDMVKVTVCKERGVVSGMDGTSYYLNHTHRSIGETKITVEEAEKALSTSLEIEAARLALVEDGSREVLTYEFVGSNGGMTYYVYVDANTGKEVEIFCVVETSDGTYLL